MRDIDASVEYSQGNEAEFRREVNKSVNACYNADQDVFIDMNQRLCVQSANGTWWRIQVSDAGAITTIGVTP